MARSRPAAPAPAGKREDILRAAMLMFQRYGFRRSSIDLIAGEAKVAKPTVYAHFADKNALFVAVTERLMDTIVTRARAALAEDGDIASRLGAALAAKFTTIFELLAASPHAAELLASSDEVARHVVEAADERYDQLLAAAIRAATRAGELDPGVLGHTTKSFIALLLQAGHGASYGASTVEQHRRNLVQLVTALVRGARA